MCMQKYKETCIQLIYERYFSNNIAILLNRRRLNRYESFYEIEKTA